MNALALLAYCTLTPASCTAGETVATFSSYHDGKRFDAVVTGAQLDDSPAWTEDADCPPLSPREAISLAAAYLPKMIEGGESWRRDDVTLTEVGGGRKWVYSVQFHGHHPPGVFDGSVPAVRIIVLMNGRVVAPRISRW